MIRLNNIQSITDFQRSPKQIVERLKANHEPIVLTVNGRAEVVVQDAIAYQELLDKVERADDLQAIREGLEQSLRGQVRPASEFFDEFESRNGL